MQRHRAITRSLSPESPYHDSDFSEEDLRIGSLVLRVRTSQPRFLPMLEELIRTRPLGSAIGKSPHTLFLTIIEDRPRAQDELDIRNQLPLARQAGGGPNGETLLEIRRDIARVVVCETDSHRTDAVIILACDGRPEERILSSIMIAIYRILYHLGRVLLHAAAIGWAGRANVFLGDKGSGKTTSSLYLGRCGFTILAEDHVLLHRDPTGFTVSGCDDRMRLTRETELRFFEDGLRLPTTDIGGVAKIELDPTTMKEINWRPFEDAPVRRLFLPSIGDEFSVEPLSSLSAVLALVSTVQERFRFADREDRQRFLDYFTDFVEPLEVYRLTLSRDLDQLDRLADWFLEREKG